MYSHLLNTHFSRLYLILNKCRCFPPCVCWDNYSLRCKHRLLSLIKRNKRGSQCSSANRDSWVFNCCTSHDDGDVCNKDQRGPRWIIHLHTSCNDLFSRVGSLWIELLQQLEGDWASAEERAPGSWRSKSASEVKWTQTISGGASAADRDKCVVLLQSAVTAKEIGRLLLSVWKKGAFLKKKKRRHISNREMWEETGTRRTYEARHKQLIVNFRTKTYLI